MPGISATAAHGILFAGTNLTRQLMRLLTQSSAVTRSNRVLLKPFSKWKGCSSLLRSSRTAYSQPTSRTSAWNKLSMHRTIMVAVRFLPASR